MNAAAAQAVAGLTVAIQRLYAAIDGNDRLRRPPYEPTPLSEIAAQQVADAEQIDLEAIIRGTEEITRRANVRARQFEQMTEAMKKEQQG